MRIGYQAPLTFSNPVTLVAVVQAGRRQSNESPDTSLKPSTDDRFSSAEILSADENRSCVMRNRPIFVVRQRPNRAGSIFADKNRPIFRQS